MQPFDEDIIIPEDNISNFQREAAYLLVTGKGLKNPLATKIERARGCVQRQIDEFQLIIDTIESGIQSAEGCYQCGDFPLQCAIEVKAKLEELMFEIDLLEIHTNRVSGADQNRVDEFLSRLTLAGQYTRAMKTLTGENKERYTHVFNSLINGDYCLEKICKETTCVPGNALCDEFNEQSGIGGLSIRLKQNPAGCNCAINLLIPGLIECVSGLIQDDELNYCEALRVVRKYSGGTQLTTEALSDPLVSQLMDTLFASNALKGPLQKIREGNLNAEEIEAEAKKYYQEFVDPGGTLECGLEGITVVAGPTGPPGPQGAPGCAGPPGEPGQNCNCPGDDPKGACCVGEYCTQVTAQQCAFFGGNYYGDGSECFDPNTGLGVRCFPPGGCGIDEDCDPGLICCNGTCVQPCPAEVGGGCPPCAPCPPNSQECPPGSGNCCPTVGGEFLCCDGICTQPCPYSGGCPTCGDKTCCDAPGEVCCGGVSCCTTEACCGNGFCCGAGQVCCDGQYCCPTGTCCGGQCYDPLTQQCCDNIPIPKDDLCCPLDGNCIICEQIAPGVHTGCYNEQFSTAGGGDVCCAEGYCCHEISWYSENADVALPPGQYTNPNAPFGYENECCAIGQNCCDRYGCCDANWQCCNQSSEDFGRGACCPPDTECCNTDEGCCPEPDNCCFDAGRTDDGRVVDFCCPAEYDCCDTKDCGNICLGAGFDSTSPDGTINHLDICGCLRGEEQTNVDIVYKGGCECGCPNDGDIECGDQCCPTGEGYDGLPPESSLTPTGLCCNEFPPGVPEEDRNPYCCAPNETCCPNQGCTVLDNCPCGQSECESGVCCNDRVEIPFVPQLQNGEVVQRCLGDIEYDDEGKQICIVAEQCCGTQCINPFECRKYVQDYFYFGITPPGSWMDLCCCAGDEFGPAGCCCPEDGTAQFTCKEAGVTSRDGSTGVYIVPPTTNCGCPCACGANADNAIVPDCKRKCAYSGNPRQQFTMKRNQRPLNCSPKEARPCSEGGFAWLQVLCDGSVAQACPEDIPDYCLSCPEVCTAICKGSTCRCCVDLSCTPEQEEAGCECTPDVPCQTGCFNSWPPNPAEMCQRAEEGCDGRQIGNTISINDIECEGFYQYTLQGCGGECGGRCAKECPNGGINNCGQHCGRGCQDCCGLCADLGDEPGSGVVGEAGGQFVPEEARARLRGNSAFKNLFGNRVEK